MCGIVCTFGEERAHPAHLLSHRGPDAFRREKMGKCTMDFYRLAINDLSDAGMQPFVRANSIFVANAEIYNHKDLHTSSLKSASDCECVHYNVEKLGVSRTLEGIRGDFAFCYSDGEHIIAARDRYGVRPLFYTRYADGSIAFASEVKALLWLKTDVHVFPPGTFYDSRLDDFTHYHTGYWNISKYVKCDTVREDIRRLLTEAVRVRLETTERDVGFLLSGGLDSSLIAAIGQRLSHPKKIKTFSIGLDGSPDLVYARKVADFLGTDHTEVKFTTEEAMMHLRDVIYSCESYDCTTIRASTPMWLLCRYISLNTKCRFILSGEGSDEVFGGYLYFNRAPSIEEHAFESMRRLRLIHQHDGLRADRCCGAWGLDLNVPFLDQVFVDYVMNMNQGIKVGQTIEKKILRQAFEGYLPEDVLWRQKDGMSDAVGNQWVDALKARGEKSINDTQLEVARTICNGHNPCKTKEEALYRELFWTFFTSKNDHLIREIWRHRWVGKDVVDPSARVLEEKRETSV